MGDGRGERDRKGQVRGDGSSAKQGALREIAEMSPSEQPAIGTEKRRRVVGPTVGPLSPLPALQGQSFREGKLALLTSLCKEHKEAFEKVLAKEALLDDRPRTLSWGSACSGSEGLHYIFNALELNYVNFSFTHCFSCESDAQKQQWIKAVIEEGTEGTDRCIFSDISEIGSLQATAFCTTHQRHCSVPCCDIFVCGTSCKDISIQGSLKGRAAGAPVLESSWSPGGSAQTFRGFLGYVSWAKPAVVLFENVDNIASEQQDRTLGGHPTPGGQQPAGR